MRGSNVLRLRRCLPIHRHHVSSPRWYSASAEPISDEEFLEACRSVYPRRKWHPWLKIGLAVSGGVDSMALVTLYSRALRSNTQLPKCHGIIIDHRAREESSEEAEWVADQLRTKFDIDSSIVKLEWPKNIDLNDTKRFETEARTLRYQALGRACKDHDISSLLVAHHADDQAETILMRLIKGRWRSGLQGMQSVQSIPECYGIYGVHNSGGIENERTKDFNLPLPIEKGKIEVLRPLLGFEKSRFIATCEEHCTKWVEDKTNQDKTLTSRNAIRHILRHHKLPQALTPRSLVSLANNMQSRVKSERKFAETLFNNAPMQLNLQTGSLIVRFPHTAALLSRPIITESDKRAARNTATLLLHRVAELVSPKEFSTIGQLASAVDRIWPSLTIDFPDKASKKTLNIEAFSMTGIHWAKWNKPSIFGLTGTLQAHHPYEWHLWRQPPHEYELEEKSIRIPSSTKRPEEAWKWHFFDGRYWIRIRNRLLRQDLTVRHFTDRDLAELGQSVNFASAEGDAAESRDRDGKHPMQNATRRLSLVASDYAFIKTALGLIKPHPLRRTLPAIFTKSLGKDVLIGLPTLDWAITDAAFAVRFWDRIHAPWEVRYKNVDMGKKSLKKSVARGIRRRDVLDVMRGAQQGFMWMRDEDLEGKGKVGGGGKERKDKLGFIR
ncbi:uncharacterized protein BDR25DRAFT_284472 [Lindgomyces ingoldianus]|uniref:Uncharacterized protein n=1 Tax=Lindgomyces ingoldianus TaxID=673940 RepID=A0ACB6QZ29_9PLEO|nr:uncharacterized protein BDR25DRAFT_284472 [Lindgomyces ingoldianus]KAF2472037.1 hypothetical protein BDR25DRAFT_284472 [Lindgomyces ingoldianus]